MKRLKAEKDRKPTMVIPLTTFTASTSGNLIAIFVIWRNQNRSNKKVSWY